MRGGAMTILGGPLGGRGLRLRSGAPLGVMVQRAGVTTQDNKEISFVDARLLF